MPTKYYVGLNVYKSLKSIGRSDKHLYRRLRLNNLYYVKLRVPHSTDAMLHINERLKFMLTLQPNGHPDTVYIINKSYCKTLEALKDVLLVAEYIDCEITMGKMALLKRDNRLHPTGKSVVIHEWTGKKVIKHSWTDKEVIIHA